MSKNEYNHADHMAQLGKITCLYEVIIITMTSSGHL